LEAVRSLAGNGNVRLILQNATESPAHQGVVVNQQN
jgi:hypothetical protein